MSDEQTPEAELPPTRRMCLAAALLEAQAGVDALWRGQPVAAEIHLKLAIDFIAESEVLP